MWLEILLTSVLGFAIYWFISRDKEETLPLEDGWWGPGTRSMCPLASLPSLLSYCTRLKSG
uniref:Epoxide hydrolase 1 microsomal isoform 2 n=4 Tax=Homininae TaxID=207598 RepID=A0A0S2Z3T1_HUMAN|nr:epoxide hydrolase 1 microsomal isoform 2 [Homo sapiens]